MSRSHVSVTELLDLQRCRRLWYYQHHRRLEPLGRPHLLASGSAVHAVVGWAANLLAEGYSRGEIEGWGAEVSEIVLREQFELDEYADEKVAKFLPGVKRAVAKLPDWFWEDWKWQSEVDLATEVVSKQGKVVEVRGRADLVGTRHAGGEIMLVEVKTTDHDPLDYLLWNPQHRFYATMLQMEQSDELVLFKYLCLPTSQGAKAVDRMSWPFSVEQNIAAYLDLARLVSDWVEFGERGGVERAQQSPSYSLSCKFCPCAPICTEILTGGSAADVIEEKFKVKQPLVKEKQNG